MPENRVLYVLRHAKSSWDDPGLEDHDRPLASRGRRATDVLAKHVRSSRITPGVVLCSSARRTRETLEGIAPPGQWLIEPELYAATPGAVLARLQELPDTLQSAMVIGHNPAMQVLVLRLATTREAASEGTDLGDVKRKFPTGALATLSFDCSWRELAPGAASLAAYVRPRQLEGR